MAILSATTGIDFINFDFNWFARNFSDSFFGDDSFVEIGGLVYEDFWSIDGETALDSRTLDLFGGGIDWDPFGELVTGQVSAIGQRYDDGAWLLEGISIPVVDIYDAALTSHSIDDWLMMVFALSGADEFYLSEVADKVDGFEGDDEIHGRGGKDILYGGPGNDDIYGGADSDLLEGGAGNDWLRGGAGGDVIRGGTGMDVIIGGRGDDFVTGENGADIFAFAVGDDKMTIMDFEPGLDDLALVDVGADFSLGDLARLAFEQGNDVVIRAGSQEIRFVNTELTDITSDDVFFV